MEVNQNTKALFLVVNAGFSEGVIKIAREAGATGATIIDARGEGAITKSFMGISVDAEKEMVICIVSEKVADNIMEKVKEKAGVKTPAHSVCFTLPVEKMTATKKDILDLEKEHVESVKE